MTHGFACDCLECVKASLVCDFCIGGASGAIQKCTCPDWDKVERKYYAAEITVDIVIDSYEEKDASLWLVSPRIGDKKPSLSAEDPTVPVEHLSMFTTQWGVLSYARATEIKQEMAKMLEEEGYKVK